MKLKSPNDDLRSRIAEFGSRFKVDAEPLRNLWRTLKASPVLAREINDAIARGSLRGIGLSDDTQPEGCYSAADRFIHLPLDALNAPPSGAFDQARITYLLGRLVQHSQRVDLSIQSQRLFEERTDRIARSSRHEHDYTEAVADRVAFLRRSEARADMAGWNALASAIRKKAALEYRVAPGLHDMFNALPNEMSRYIDVGRRWTWPVHKLRADLYTDDKLFMHAREDNIEAMARNGFDRSLTSHHHGSPNRAGRQVADVIGVVGRVELARRASRDNEMPHDARIDMGRLGLNPRVVEQYGIELAGAGRHASLLYFDKSSVALTYDVLRNSCAVYAYDPVRPHSSPSSDPDHRLYQQALKAVYRLDAKHGRRPDSCSEKLAASLAASARQDGLKTIHRAVLSADGREVSAVQDHWLPWLRKTSRVDVEQALRESGKADRGRCEVEGASAPRLRYGPEASRSSSMDLMGMQWAGHPDHRLYRQALKAVYRLDAELGRRPDEHSERLAASLVASARKDGLKAIHRVVLSDDRGQAFGVQDGAFPCWRKTTHVWVEQAIHTLVSRSSRQCDDLRARAQPPRTHQPEHQPRLQKPHALAR